MIEIVQRSNGLYFAGCSIYYLHKHILPNKWSNMTNPTHLIQQIQEVKTLRINGLKQEKAFDILFTSLDSLEAIKKTAYNEIEK